MAEQNQENRETTDQTSTTTGFTGSQIQSNFESQRRASTDTTRTTLPSYSSLATDTPPAYSHQPKAPPNHQTSTFQQPRNPASAATIRAIMGNPVPQEPRRSLRDRLLCRRPTYNRRPPSAERERGSSARWNVWGSPISDPK